MRHRLGLLHHPVPLLAAGVDLFGADHVEHANGVLGKVGEEGGGGGGHVAARYVAGRGPNTPA